jgi:hypothetical protein
VESSARDIESAWWREAFGGWDIIGKHQLGRHRRKVLR